MRVILVYLMLISLLPGADLHIAVVQWRGETDADKGFREAIIESGHQVTWDIYDCAMDKDKAADVVTAISANPPDLVQVFSTGGMLAIVGKPGEKNRIPTSIPVVFTVVGDPVGAGLVTSLTNPGRNLTGVTHLIPLERQIPILRATLPFTRLGCITVPDGIASRLQGEELFRISITHGFTVNVVEIDPNEALDKLTLALRHAANAGLDAFYLPSDSALLNKADTITAAARNAGIPMFSATEAPVRNGGAILGVVGQYRAVGRFAAAKALRILIDKIPAGTIPIEPLPTYGIVLNRTAAKAHDLWPPVDLICLSEVIDGK